MRTRTAFPQRGKDTKKKIYKKKKTNNLTRHDDVTAQETRANVSLEITYQYYVEIASTIQNKREGRNHLVTIWQKRADSQNTFFDSSREKKLKK